jgi:hypothetical protein
MKGISLKWEAPSRTGRVVLRPARKAGGEFKNSCMDYRGRGYQIVPDGLAITMFQWSVK